MEAIGGDKFEAMASKVAQFDQTLLDRTSMLGDMFGKSSSELGDRMHIHETKFAMVYGKLTALERSVQEAGSRPAESGGSRLRIPDPAGWKLDVLKGRDDGFFIWREGFDLQTGSIWHKMEKVLETIRDLKEVVGVEQYNWACYSHSLGYDGD